MADSPNLLFIFTDEQRADTMACYGNDRISDLAARIRARQRRTGDNAPLP